MYMPRTPLPVRSLSPLKIKLHSWKEKRVSKLSQKWVEKDLAANFVSIVQWFKPPGPAFNITLLVGISYVSVDVLWFSSMHLGGVFLAKQPEMSNQGITEQGQQLQKCALSYFTRKITNITRTKGRRKPPRTLEQRYFGANVVTRVL
jgi:hypothetical protein